MKRNNRLFTFFLLMSFCVVGLLGCSNNTTVNPEPTLKSGTTLQDIVDGIQAAIPVQMPAPLDETSLQDLFYLNSDSVEEYAGVFSMTMTSSDNVIAIKAKPGKADAVVEALNKRKTDVVDSFSRYLPDQHEKAQAGKVIQKGDYVFLVIAGNYELGYDKEIVKAEGIINDSFNK